MKSVFVFCTKWYVFLTELPLAAILGLTIYYNQYSDNLLKFYPLIFVLALGMILYFLYFFRFILISYDEIRYIGLFSSRDSAVINKDKTIIIRFLSYGRLKISLFGTDGKAPALDWAQSDENYTPVEIFLFRGKAVGGKRCVKRILKYFSVPKEEHSSFINSDFEGKYEYAEITSSIVNDSREIRIKITETV